MRKEGKEAETRMNAQCRWREEMQMMGVIIFVQSNCPRQLSLIFGSFDCLA